MSSSIVSQQSLGLASGSQSGLVSTTTQTFAGNKTFNNYLLTPSRPAFWALSSGGNQTTASGVSLVFNGGTNFNIGNHYNPSNYTFTAPIAGLYYFWLGYFNNGTSERLRLSVNGGSANQPYILASDGVIGSAQTCGYSIYLQQNDSVTIIGQYGGGTYYGGHTAWGGFFIG
jgi:hypothetical protein